jgi:hypothetical protein
VGDTKQLPTICKHSLKKDEVYCINCHISMAPRWSTTSHHNLLTFMRHVTDPIFLQILNIICVKQATQIEINNVLSCCYISKVDTLSHVDCDTMILCSHRKNVDKYNNILIQKIFQPHEIFYVTMKTNATCIENVQNSLNDPKFDHIKYISIGAKVMITKNINIYKGVINGANLLAFDDNKMVTSITIKVICTNVYVNFK